VELVREQLAYAINQGVFPRVSVDGLWSWGDELCDYPFFVGGCCFRF